MSARLTGKARVADEQSQLVAAFEAGCVDGAPSPVKRIDTHMSHVFLSGERAFKLKRAVRLPFADLSTLAQRRVACLAEISINQAFAPGLYLGARPVTYRDNRFEIDGAGAIIDWVVVMRRFDQALQFDELARTSCLTRTQAEAAATAAARAHAKAPPTSEFGHAKDYAQIIATLRRTEAHGASEHGVAPTSPLLYERLARELARVTPLIEARRQAGKVRRGHGDLHLGNICILEGQATPFDALEFDERMATTDVLYDLAFLLMDLRHAGLVEHANAAMNRYWDETGEDEAALELLPFFMGLRACVRMAVATVAGNADAAHTYRSLGLRLLRRKAPMLIALGGLSGAGKSVIAAAIAPMLPGPAGARLLRSDILRKARARQAFDAPAPAGAYAPERRAEVYRDLAARAAQATGAGASVVADATFRVSSTRDAIESAARGARFVAYWLDAPLAVRLARVAQRAGDASDADVAVAATQTPPHSLSPSWRRLDASRAAPAIVDEVLRDIDPRCGERPNGAEDERCRNSRIFCL
jgi:aminoglycoside phosphotransferase family enzyme/predicted kinase